MFRVSFFCDDRKLAGALRVLVGVAVGAPEVAPVEETPAADNKPPGPRSYNGGPPLVPQFAEWLRAGTVTELRLHDIKAWLASIGRNPTNAQHVAKLATKKGYLKREGEGRATIYTVATEPPALIAKASKRGVRIIKRRKS
jgi:hypothetical protein